jgi:hypothetical protein
MRIHAMRLLGPERPDEAVRRPVAEVGFGRRAFLQWVAGAVVLGAHAGSPRGSSANAPTPASAPSPVSPSNRPNTSRTAREEAQREMPLANLQEPLRKKVSQIVADPTVYRRMPIEVVPCDPDLYLFLVRYPEVVVNMWQLMGVTKVTVDRKGPYTYDAQDGAGTASRVELIYGTREKHLFLAEGHYEGPLLPRRVTGRCALLLTSAYSLDAEQRDYVSNKLDVFLQVDNVGAELVARTLHPLMGKTVDSNFSETIRFLSQVSHVAESNGPGVQRLVTRLTNVDPVVRDRFAQITTTLSQRTIMRAMAEEQDAPAERLGGLVRDPNQVTK